MVCLCVCGVVCVFLKMKEHLAGKQDADGDLQHAVMDWLNRLAADWYDASINKLVSRYKCLNVVSMWRSWRRRVLQSARSFSFLLLIHISAHNVHLLCVF
jgi:hypothetical protein